MRALFLLLLLANLLFAGWALWIAPPRTPAGHVTRSSQGDRSIRLLREAPQAGEAGFATSTGETAVDLATVACVSAGPYLERTDVEQVMARLQGLGFTARLRPSHEEVRVGHWVRLDSLATPEDATNALGALGAAGVADAYVLTDEGAGTVVSLGVFTDAARVEEIVAAARAAGFEPHTVDRLREADVFWLDIDRQSNAGMPAPEQLRAAAAGTLPELELRPCPATEPASAAASGSAVSAPKGAPEAAPEAAPAVAPPATAEPPAEPPSSPSALPATGP